MFRRQEFQSALVADPFPLLDSDTTGMAIVYANDRILRPLRGPRPPEQVPIGVSVIHVLVVLGLSSRAVERVIRFLPPTRKQTPFGLLDAVQNGGSLQHLGSSDQSSRGVRPSYGRFKVPPTSTDR